MKAPLPPDHPMPPPLPPTPDHVIIRKDYDPKGNLCFHILGDTYCITVIFTRCTSLMLLPSFQDTGLDFNSR